MTNLMSKCLLSSDKVQVWLPEAGDLYPATANDLREFIGPIKPCPFCGSVALERDGFEEHIVCKNCGASAPVSGWQFRASIN